MKKTKQENELKDYLILEHHYDLNGYITNNIYVGILSDVPASEAIEIVDKLTKRANSTEITYSAEVLE